MRLQPFACWDCRFESHWGLDVFSFECSTLLGRGLIFF
jgi:hypothetical protein